MQFNTIKIWLGFLSNHYARVKFYGHKYAISSYEFRKNYHLEEYSICFNRKTIVIKLFIVGA